MVKAFEILVEQHRPMLLSYARALFYGDQHAAEDLVQEVFLAAHHRLDTLRQGENFGRWLRGIARNKALESHRAARRRPVVADSRVIEGMDEVYTVLDATLLGEEQWHERLQRWVRHCVERLSRRLKDAVVRVYKEGMSLREAAAAENMSSAAVAQRLSRARKLIRKCVQDQSEKEA